MRRLSIGNQVTNRENSYLQKYLNEVSKIKLISTIEEADLSRRIQAGDMHARDLLAKANLRFVISVAKKYQNYGLSLADLVNEGNLGLMEAAQRFDDTRGFKFISFAVWWIRQAIISAVSANARIVRLPINRISLISKVRKIIAELEQKYEREPTIIEITQALNLTQTDVRMALNNIGRYISLDAPLVQDEEENMYDILFDKNNSGPDKELMNDSLRKEIDSALNTMTRKEADIIRLFFGLNGTCAHTLEEIGKKFQISSERARQIKDRAIRRLKYSPRSKILQTYVS
jgi:RNA polymerase primary sigma factor